MHPALSVIFFTTLSGAGLGLLFLLALRQIVAPTPFDPALQPAAYLVGGVLLAIGLLSSTLHLGKPLRSWRAFSQWRSSWLSREGIVSVALYVPLTVVLALLSAGRFEDLAWATVPLALLAALAVLCTSRIYDTLKTIPAWYDRLVLPNYAAIALLTGLAWYAALSTLWRGQPHRYAVALLGVGIVALAVKVAYWRRIDAKPMPTSTGSLTGLDRFGSVRAFESPHTETNYLLREMGFVLARKHARRLRRIALVLGFVLPIVVAIAMLSGFLRHASVAWLLLVLVHVGVFVERWLFFAEAKHVVTLYYPRPSARS